MPRNGSGTYTLPSGNPVVSGTIIEASWANSTLADLADAITNSLARNGEGGMTAPLRLTDGVVATPSLAFANETGSGLYRTAAGDIGLTVLGSRILRLQSGGASVAGTLGVSGASTLDSLGVTNNATVGGTFGVTGTSTFAAASATNFSYTGTLTGGTGVINIGSGQVYKDASGNVGIGTASPNSKLEVVSAANTSAYRLSCAYGTLGEAYQSIYWNNSSFSGGNSEIRNIVNGAASTGSALSFLTSQTGTGVLTERLRIDNSGNLGLGVTPSAWGTRAFDLGPYASFSSIGGADISLNAYYNGGWKYKTTGAASLYSAQFGSHVWSIAPSGTAGNAISFTQAMTLDTGGNLLVGATTALIATSGRGNITINGSGSSILSFGIAGTSSGYIYSDANFLEIVAQSSRSLRFSASGSEKARITSDGNLLVGTTSAPVSGTPGVQIAPGGIIRTGKSGTNPAGHISFNNANGEVGVIVTDGTSTIYNTSSDYRLKNIIGDLTNSGSFIDALKPKFGTWKVDGSKFVGFLAHEFAEVSPSSVYGIKDDVDENGNPKYQGMQASSAEVMANVIAELQSLRKRVAELEAA